MDYLKAAGVTAVICLAIFGFAAIFMTDSDGIHPIGSNAVYIAGEGCTINAPLNRKDSDMLRDFEMCVNYHRVYQGLKAYDKNGGVVATTSSGN